MAYLFMGPAIRGEFELNIIQIIGFPIAVILSFMIYIFGLRRAGKKQYSLKKLFVFGFMASLVTILLFLTVLLGSTLLVDPIYRAGSFGNTLVIVACALIFIGLAYWSKAWFILVLPIILFIPDVVVRYYSIEPTQLIFLSAGTSILTFAVLIVYAILKGKRSAVGR